MTIWKDSAIARRMRITSTRTVETMDMTAMDAMAAAATETTAEGTMAADSLGHAWKFVRLAMRSQRI